jgi:LuxR family maltose regulon positive regulatory protein
MPEDLLRAHQVLDALADIAERTDNTRVKIEILAVRALAFEAQGNPAAALETLQQALDLARPGGLVRVFVDLGPNMLNMLKELVGTGYLADIIRRIIAAFPDHDSGSKLDESQPQSIQRTSGEKSSILAESLTTREREILIYLREPTSLKEIAVKLSISYATIKRHTINIYGKLGVNSRWEAVNKATHLGLLPSR